MNLESAARVPIFVLSALLVCGCTRSDAHLKTGTCLEVCEFTADYTKTDVSDIHPTTKLSSLQSGPLEYALYLSFTGMHFDVRLENELSRLAGTSQRTTAIGKCTMKDFADAIDRLRAETDRANP